ncbi:MAG: hypothetical protein J6J18_10330 [Oscillospiraceae bacterium]|nr:hypothetical protein [Oscillospiraceae bacterium]
MKKRLFSLLLAALMFISVLPGMGFAAEAATKEEPKRVIGIVFDDSGSMYYGGGNYSWCRATYAVEVFAAMLNDGDQLQIYPMNSVTLGGSGTEYTMYNPLIINGPEESTVVREMVGSLGGTPIEAIDRAHEGLMNTQADEKYLIVLTDGGTFHNRNGVEMSSYETEQQLTEVLGEYCKDMNVMYLGIGSGVALPDVVDPSTQLFLEASDSAETLNKLTEMCNTIFGRNELRGVTNSITFDVAMSKLIVFVQGENVGDVSVAQGTQLRATDTHYPLSNQGSVDTSLQGMLVTYGEFKAGTYDLSYSGTASNVSVYYEPDVDMYVYLTDENGNEVDINSTLYAGTYYLEYGMKDENGPTTSALLGETKYELTYTINGQEYTETPTASGRMPLELKANDVLTGKFKVTYLNDYTIEKNDIWPENGIQIQPMPLEELVITVSGGSDTYALTDLESQAVYDVQVTYGDEKLTGDALKAVTLNPSLTGGNAECVVAEYTDDTIRLGIRYCGGDAADTECGDYELSITADYINGDGQSISSQPVAQTFTIVDDSSAVSAKFEMEQDYYTTSELATAAPIRLVLSLGGAPLTAEQFEQVVVEDIDVDGLACDIQPDPSNSCYTIKIRSGEVENGKYKLSCHVQIPDNIGRLQETTDSASLEIQPYPSWLPWLIRILIALCIAAIIWAYLNTKILPKRIGVGKCTFNIDGSNVSGSPSCVYVGGNKKRGTLEITSPRYAANPSATCGFRLELEADSPRRTKSAARSVKVHNVTALNPTTTFLKINAFKMIRDPNTERLVKAVGKADAPIEFTIKNNTNCTVTAEILDVIAGGTITVNLTVNLKFF